MTAQAPDVEVLQPEASHTEPSANPETSAKASMPSPVASRCQHRYANGKQCRQLGLESQSGLCSHHFRLGNPSVTFPSTPGNDSTDLSADLLRGRLIFSSAEGLREFLTRCWS